MGTPAHDDTDLVALLASGGDLNSFLGDLVHLAVGHTPAAQACGLTLARSSGAVTVNATGPLAQEADERQYEVDDGPCLQAMREGVLVRVDDMTEETRWGDFPSLAVRVGVRSSLSLPLEVEGRSRGALNLYSTEPAAFDDDARETAGRWAAQASGALAVALRIADGDDRADRLAGGLDTRTTIGQAIGLVMAQERCSAEQAFALLRVSSQRRNVKLRDVAAALVASFEAELPERPDRW
ncbi:GAF and ANTAR domain-containing protein [Geodermatophilus sabuli]|uniref:GAF domain-containing protein n=1 Tax=Geodermatophilus sabuli TaxID=1564158 RepID=A0A285EDU3_9ACTN|nr:GAF and ANTAR domain-containing protein [Geodermatophilus sabuli]MBB3085351.1 GAF domain-containing protein [Geodermatophilus sabuli]SNX96221.1 GAF domain-containing protein [Geodermatophilus sabuli]